MNVTGTCITRWVTQIYVNLLLRYINDSYLVWFMVLNATFRRSVLLVEETGVPGETRLLEFLLAAAIAYRYSHLSKGNDAQHWMKACLKWVIGTVHIRYICLSLLVILEVEDITRKCTFGYITKKGGVWLSRHTISSAPFLQSKQCLNPKMFLKQIKTYWNILIV